MLMLTAGALGGGAVASSGFAQSATSKAAGGVRVPARSPLEWLPKSAQRGGDASALAGAPSGGQHRLTSFLNLEEGIKEAKYNFKKLTGWSVQIKPTGYRGIPLYTVFDLTLSLDGTPVDPDSIVFVYGNAAYKPSELKNLTGMQWWVFDWATLFVPGSITKTEHEVDVHYKYINTYGLKPATATNGAKEKLHFNPEMDYLCL